MVLCCVLCSIVYLFSILSKPSGWLMNWSSLNSFHFFSFSCLVNDQAYTYFAVPVFSEKKKKEKEDLLRSPVFLAEITEFPIDIKKMSWNFPVSVSNISSDHKTWLDRITLFYRHRRNWCHSTTKRSSSLALSPDIW